jgi:hypothetical protein
LIACINNERQGRLALAAPIFPKAPSCHLISCEGITMESPADLFTLAILATGGLYFCMLAYFNGLLGTKQSNMPIQWNSEPLLWYMAFLLMLFVAFRIIEPDPSAQGTGVWYQTGTGNLLIIYIYLSAKLARHAVPRLVAWAILTLIALAVLYVFGGILLAVAGGSDTAIDYPQRLGTLLLLMTVLLSLILAWCFLVSFWTAFLKHRRTDPASIERHTSQGSIVPGSGSPDYRLAPGASVALDFGKRQIEDHGYKADLRVDRQDTDAAVKVEVSNDSQSWLACELDEKITTDYDVPYMGSPWRFVRVTNTSDQEVQIDGVYDLD